MAHSDSEFVSANLSISDIRDGGRRVHRVEDSTILFHRMGAEIFATEPRCPHMGYPLTKATMDEGILRCHWHHWRFDVASGGCFTPGGDDLKTWPVRVIDDQIWVARSPRAQDFDHDWNRLEEGLRGQRLFLLSRATIHLLGAEIRPVDVVKRAVSYALQYPPSGIPAGLMVMSAMARMTDRLPDNPDKALALVHGLRHLAGDMVNRPPRQEIMPFIQLVETSRLREWFLTFLEEREALSAERVLRTFMGHGGRFEEALQWLVEGATHHVFLSTGHVLDALSQIAALGRYFEEKGVFDSTLQTNLLVAGIRPITQGFRHEEDIDWMEFLPDLNSVRRELSNRGAGERQMVPVINVSDLLTKAPRETLSHLLASYQTGTPVRELLHVVMQAALERLAQFPTVNHDDWDTVHHGVTYGNGLDFLAEQLGATSPDTDRALVMAGAYLVVFVYMNRFLNVPRYQLPHRKTIDDYRGKITLSDARIAAQNGYIDETVEILSHWQSTHRDMDQVMALWISTVLNEDSGFHAMQALDAGIRLVDKTMDPETAVFANVRFTVAQRDRRAVQRETKTAWALFNGTGLPGDDAELL